MKNMFVLSNTHAAYRVVAMLVAVATLMWTLGVHMEAQAANITQVTDTLSDSAPSVGANHTIVFTTPTGVAASESIVLTFPTTPDSFDLGVIGTDDIDLDVGGDETLADSGSEGAGEWGVATTSTTITLTSGGAGAVIAANATVTIEIGTHAASGGAGDAQITNPDTSNTSYEILVSAGSSDSGATRVAIVDTVTVTAAVNTTFDFVVTGLATSSAVNGTSTTGSSSPTSIPFGQLTAGEVKTLAQRLNVTTNARNGFVVTVEQDQNLLSSTGADIDSFQDGNYLNTPGVWAAPSNTILQENTYGHWGLTSTDDLNTDEFGSNLWVAASTTPRQIFHHNGPADGTTDNVGSSTIGYQIEISPLQEAADDYTTTLTYIATPTF